MGGINPDDDKQGYHEARIHVIARHPGRSSNAGNAARADYLRQAKAEVGRYANIIANGGRQIVFKEIRARNPDTGRRVNISTRKQAGNLVRYITAKTDKHEATNEWGFKESPDQWKETLKHWDADFREPTEKNPKPRNVGHFMASLPAGMDHKRFASAVGQFLQKTFAENYSYLYGLHLDEENPHIHIALHRNGRDGKALVMDSGQLERWRVDLAAVCREHGLDVDASPRHERGAFTPSIPQEIHHMIKDGRRIDRRLSEIDTKSLTKRERSHLSRILRSAGEFKKASELYREISGNDKTAKSLDKYGDQIIDRAKKELGTDFFREYEQEYI